MSVTVDVNQALYRSPDGQRKVGVNGGTVGECLAEAAKQLPGLEKALLDQDGRLLNYVDVFVNGKSAFPEELAKVTHDGDIVQVTRARR
jgi:hypothetical protein